MLQCIKTENDDRKWRKKYKHKERQYWGRRRTGPDQSLCWTGVGSTHWSTWRRNSKCKRGTQQKQSGLSGSLKEIWNVWSLHSWCSILSCQTMDKAYSIRVQQFEPHQCTRKLHFTICIRCIGIGFVDLTNWIFWRSQFRSHTLTFFAGLDSSDAVIDNGNQSSLQQPNKLFLTKQHAAC